MGKISIFGQPLNSFYQYRPYTSFNTKETIRSLVKSDAEFEILAAQFNQRMAEESKAFLAIFIPILALGSMVVNYRRRTYFSEHLVFSTHYFTFVLMLFAVCILIINKPYFLWIRPEESASAFKTISSFATLVLTAAYFSIASRRFYKISWLRAILGSVVVTLVFMISLMAYRMGLFYKIIYSLH